MSVWLTDQRGDSQGLGGDDAPFELLSRLVVSFEQGRDRAEHP